MASASLPQTILVQQTKDVLSDTSTFEELLLPKHLCSALAAAGFVHPSPVQEASLPIALTGADLIIQAKSGTGKTLVFSVASLNISHASFTLNSFPKVLVVAPTREIAVQVLSVMNSIAVHMPGPAPVCVAFIGGMPIAEDQKKLRRRCDIVSGTPGRLGELHDKSLLVLSHAKAFVMDEVDRLLDDGMYDDVAYLYEQLPKHKQVLALSATFTPELMESLLPMMKKPQRINLCESTVSLLGIRQLYSLISPPIGTRSEAHGMISKADALLKLLRRLAFNQAVCFCNDQTSAAWLADWISAQGFPSAFISAKATQPQRMAIMTKLEEFQLRVVVSTDLLARGIDLEYVNLVVNLDLPADAATYMHRVGRTGRFGTYGMSVTLVQSAELTTLRTWLLDIAGGTIEEVPEVIPESWYKREVRDADKAAMVHMSVPSDHASALLPSLASYSKAPHLSERGRAPAQYDQAQMWHKFQEWQRWNHGQSQPGTHSPAMLPSWSTPPANDSASLHDGSINPAPTHPPFNPPQLPANGSTTDQVEHLKAHTHAVIDHYTAAAEILPSSRNQNQSHRSSALPCEPLQVNDTISPARIPDSVVTGLGVPVSGGMYMEQLLRHVMNCSAAGDSVTGTCAQGVVSTCVADLIDTVEHCSSADLRKIEMAVLRRRMRDGWSSWTAAADRFESMGEDFG